MGPTDHSHLNDYDAIMRFMRGSSAASTNPFFLRLRLRFCDFFVKMWLANAFPRFRRPVPVVLKRFLAPLFDFILGITLNFHLQICTKRANHVIREKLTLYARGSKFVSEFSVQSAKCKVQSSFLPFLKKQLCTLHFAPCT